MEEENKKNSKTKAISNGEKGKIKDKINLRGELKGGVNRKKDYQIDYRVNQKRRMIERLEYLLEQAKELPTETYEYGYYNLNTNLENYESKMTDLIDKAEERGH